MPPAPAGTRASSDRSASAPAPSRRSEQPADARRRDREAELGPLTADPAMTPARGLARKPHQQSPNGKVEEREDHAADPPNPRVAEQRHEYWRPSRSGSSKSGAGGSRSLGRCACLVVST